MEEDSTTVGEDSTDVVFTATVGWGNGAPPDLPVGVAAEVAARVGTAVLAGCGSTESTPGACLSWLPALCVGVEEAGRLVAVTVAMPVSGMAVGGAFVLAGGSRVFVGCRPAELHI